MEFRHCGNNHRHYLDGGAHDGHRSDNDDDTDRDRDADDGDAMGHNCGADDMDHSHDNDYDGCSSRLPHQIHNQRCRTIGHR